MRRKSIGTVRLLIAAIAVMVFAAAPAVWAAGSDEIVQLKIRSDKENATIEVPLPVLEFLQKHKVCKKLDAGTINGQKVTLSLDQLMRALKDTRAKGGETLLMKIEEPKETTTIHLALAKDTVSRPGKKPTSVVLTAKDRDEEGPTRITVPLSTVDMIFGSIKVEGEGHDDTTPLFRDLLSFARDMGTGMLARVVSDDGEVTLTLE